jgi:hypothetical protein
MITITQLSSTAKNSKQTVHPGKRKPRYSKEMLEKGTRFRVGILWHIERDLAALKTELFGPQHEKAAAGVRSLTEWQAEIQAWSTYKATSVMVQLAPRIPKIVNTAIQEATEAERVLAEAIAGVLGRNAEAA